MTAFGAIIADTLTKPRAASGEVVLELCQKTADGRWEVIDRAKGTLTATASVLDLGTSKEFKSDLSWEPRSELGRQVSVKQSGPGKAIVNTATGEVSVEVTYNVSVDGQTFTTAATLTNKSVSTPLGTLTGKKLEIKGTTFSAGLSGTIELKQRNVIERLAKEPAPGVKQPAQQLKGQPQQQAGSEKKEPKNSTPTSTKATAESLVVVIRAQGSSSER